MKHVTIMAVVWAVAALANIPAWGQVGQSKSAPAATSPAVMLEKGIYAEETVGDLDAAIKVYQQIVDDAKANKQFAAQAQYRLAMCYLKKGEKAKARQELQELLASYPQEKAIAAQAQTQLAKLGGMGEGRMRDFVLLVIGGDGKSFTFEGQKTTLEELPELLKKVPDRSNTVLEFAVASTDLAESRKRELAASLMLLVRDLGFEYLSDTGVKPLGSKGDPAQWISTASTSGPHVVRTAPEALANDVDPSLDKITVTFDRGMMDKSWSWTGGGETFPKSAGSISYDSPRTTCTNPVKLEPGKIYWVGINSPSHRNFKSADGAPARRYVILFATKSADGKPTPLPEDMVKQAAQINAPAPAGPPRVDAQKARALVEGMRALTAGVYKAMDQNDSDTALTLLRQEIAQGRELLAVVAGTPAEAPVKAGMPMLERIEAALAAKDVEQANKLLKTMNSMGPVLDRGLTDALGDKSAAATAKAQAPAAVHDISLVNAASEKVHDFVLDLRQGNIENAYKQTSEDYRKNHTGLDKFAANVDLSKTEITRILVSDEAACVLASPVSAKDGKVLGAMGFGLIRFGDGWLIRDIDQLPTDEAGQKFVDEYRKAYPKYTDFRVAIVNGIVAMIGEGSLTGKLVTWVEKFFSENYRDITARKTLEWRDPEVTSGGNLSIRYKYLATIWGKDQLVIEQRFTFSPEGKYISAETIAKGPASQPATASQRSGKTAAGGGDTEKAKGWVEDFFRHNYRDVTTRETIEWGDVVKDAKGNLSIRYKFLATIWGKDKVTLNKVFTFTSDGKYVSDKDAAGESVSSQPATAKRVTNGK